MSNRKFVLTLSRSNVETRNQVTNFIKDQGAGWWHYIDDMWLIDDPHGTRDSYEWMEDIKALIKNVEISVMVIWVKEGIYAAYAERDGHQWLENNWNWS